ncbi:uncharacterized protein LOC122026894 isoform X1 [Zingiber officinale]|uniref:uncharacterized protein LOC122026894 isoform X1 n=1 Tax=Zingiber officinale TaxID=94328 RepID=UPI001C4BDA01|nr:uncharacterized protein LOC122026894 isoform X1 [Zingiber officinale]XP_042441568.1 uncharacterized protein LOC122026894 isoform X1 [Zingiber officinale]XP_042441576.1 uncharacterized protein LOC122026894 isoform X1 [Zingiber officinale]XP_042441584.1 uncharacterized protein LOC122026894 isoform X1 [Zingiber officinale]XP_042441594.1 uncharacterized protein LOC122026894 isoform X1 [Zingiber officinale]
MVIAGNMNLVQPSHPTALQNLGNGDGTLNYCSRAMRSMGFMPQQNDHFIHGLPVPGTSSLDQYSHFLELSNNCNNLITNSDATIEAKSSNPSTIQSGPESTQRGFLHDNTLDMHNLQDRNAYVKSPMQDLANGVTVGKFQQASNLHLHDQFQEFHGRQEQDAMPTNLQGKQVSELGNSPNVACLDPMEQKLLFGTDADNNWGVLFSGSLMSGMDGNVHAQQVDNDHYGAFPSIQSGSWSALMQEAVQASTSYKGQEEWSGLSKTEPIRTLLCATDDGKQSIGLDDDSSYNQVSLIAQPFATPSSLTGNNRLLLKTAHGENSTATTEASHACLRSSLQETNSKEFGNSQNQSRLVEGGVEVRISSASENETKLIGAIQAKIPFSIGIWDGQSIEQNHNTSENVQLKSQDNGNGNLGQQNLLLSNVSFQPVNSLGRWISSHATESRGDTPSSYDRIPENHVDQGAGTQFVKPNIACLKMQSEDSLAGNLGSVRHPNSLKLKHNMHQQAMDEQKSVFGRNFACNMYVTSDVVKDDEENQTQCDLSTTPAAEVLSHNFESQNSIHHGQLSMGPNIFQNSAGNLKRKAEPSFQPNHHLNLQSLPNSVFSGSNNIGQSFNGNSHFAGHVVGNNPNDTSEGVRVEAEQPSIDAKPLHPSSSSYDESRAQYTQNQTISQASNNMLELLYKVDQSRNENSVNASDKAILVVANVPAARVHSDCSSNSRGFGLHLAPPSQRQSLPDKDPIYQKLLNGDMIGQSGYVEAGCQDQSQSSHTSLGQPLPPLDEASETANGHKISSLPREQENEHLEANKYFNSSSVTASDFPLAQNHQQEHLQFPQQDRSGVQGRLQQQQGHISNRNQDNEGALMKQPEDSNNTAVAGESFQALPILSSRFSASGVASNAQNHITCGSQFFSGRADHMKPTFAEFSQITSFGHRLPSVDTKQVLQSSESVMSNQAGFSKLHNVWTTISAQRRQAGITPILAPNVLQSIINHGRDRSSWGMPKAHSQLNKEESAPELSTCSSNSRKEENSAHVKSSNILEEKMDVVSRASNMFQGEETATLDGGSSVSVSSLVSLHQQDVNKAKHEHNLALRSQDLLSSLTSVISSRSSGICEHMPKPSDGQQKNYSFLHQIQSTKASDSDMNTLAENMLRGTSFNTPQMNLNVNQRFNHRDNPHSRYLPDVKVVEASYVSDAQMLNSNSNVHKDKDPRTSTAGQDDLQSHIHPLCTNSTATASGGNDCTRISPHMVPTSFEHYGIYQNGKMVALYDAQKSVTTSTQQYSLQNVTAGMEDSVIVEQRLDNIHAGGYREGALSSKTSPNESSPLLPNTSDHGAILRPKKRKGVTMDMPWHKIVTESLQSLESISMAELAWNLSADRLMEKVDDEAEAVEDGPSFPHSRRRLILTTQLMQQLVPALPSELLNRKATSAYQSLSFVVAKSALADACSIVPSSKNDWHEPLVKQNMMLGQLGTSNKFTEDSVTKSNKLQADFSRLFLCEKTLCYYGNKKGSPVHEAPAMRIPRKDPLMEKETFLLDVRLECQELERFSIVNRLAKFHGRTHPDAVEVSASGTVPRRTFAQRHITALSMQGNLPDGVMCLSL